MGAALRSFLVEQRNNFHYKNNELSPTSDFSIIIIMEGSILHYDDDDDDDENENDDENEDDDDDNQDVCCICGTPDQSRRLCHFLPTMEDPTCVIIHLFCGKTAGILPHVNRPDLELLTKANLKNKYGSGVAVTAALQKCRTCRMMDGSRITEYYIVGEFERVYHQLLMHDNQHQQLQQPMMYQDDQNYHSDDIDNDINDNEDEEGNHYYQNVPDPMYPMTITTSSKRSNLNTNYANVSPEPTVPDTTKQPSSEYHDVPISKKMKLSSSYQISMDHLQQVCEREQGIGYNVVRGVARAEQEGDHNVEDDDFDPNLCSKEQVNHIRIIINTERREEYKVEMEALLLSEQFTTKGPFTMEFSNQVIRAYNQFQNMYHQVTLTWPERIDMLLGFTEKVKEYDHWMYEHAQEWKGKEMVAGIAMLWKDALKYQPQDLGMDPEFTFPGVLVLLEHFRAVVEEAGADPPLLFHFYQDSAVALDKTA